MEEMTAVRELRADAPFPDRARLAPGRIRLVEATQRKSRARSRARLGRRWAALGAATAVGVITAATLVVTQLVMSGGDRSVQSPPVVRMDDLKDAATVLNRAADAAEKLPDPKPRAGQWVYHKSLNGRTKQNPVPLEQEGWTLYADPAFENGKEGDDRSYRERYEFVDRLPADPERALAKVRAWYPGPGENRGAHSFGASRVLVKTSPMPPDGLARLYRAMATIEGLKVVGRLVEDARGQGAIAVYFPDRRDAFQNQLLFDPETFTYVGTRMVATAEYPRRFGDKDDRTSPGDVLINSLVLETGLVERKGQRP